MNKESEKLYVAFVGHQLISRGPIEQVVEVCKKHHDEKDPNIRLALYDENTGRAVDIDFERTLDEVLKSLSAHPVLAESQPQPVEDTPKGPGRPKLGVISREVTLLERHWAWLGRQNGSASATLRRLVDKARKENPEADRYYDVREALHHFLWDLAGDFSNFEEATRSLFRNELDAMLDLCGNWPNDIRDYLKLRVEILRELKSQIHQ